MSGVAGLIVRVGDASYFVPVERVGFVAPVREVRDGCLVMPRGVLPLVEVSADGTRSRPTAVAVRTGADFVALAADAVELADESTAAEAVPISAIEDVLASGVRGRS